MLFSQQGEFSTILIRQKLLQNFVVDKWTCAEQNHLRYVRKHQAELQANVYNGVVDIIGETQNRELEMRELGRRVFLPLSHIRIVRHMFKIYQDSMVITWYFSHSNIFLTMMANPRWAELIDVFLPWEKTKDRADLVAQVFELKC